MGYVASAESVVLFGGTDTAPENDTWVFDPAQLVFINFNNPGGCSGIGPLYGEVGNSIILPAAPCGNGWLFQGWFTAATGGTRVGGAGDSYPTPTSPTTLYGQWISKPDIGNIISGQGPTSGGTHITIFGGPFESGATVVIGQGNGPGAGAIPCTNVVVTVSAGKITCVTGGGAKAGTWYVFVINPDGGITSTVPNGPTNTFSYENTPKVSSLGPRTGPVSGGTSITLKGSGFFKGATVLIGQGNGPFAGAIACTSVVVVSSSEITCVTGGGAAAGTFSVFVRNTDGVASAGNIISFFTYQ